ncbi:hypothetical protein HYU13_00705 [Candidatus Woesearchaeota archaeon]|nr:hypothetical protein [Candidatus Woesearchaeota archaeon]
MDILPPPPPSVIRTLLQKEELRHKSEELHQLEEIRKLNEEVLAKAREKKEVLKHKELAEKKESAPWGSPMSQASNLGVKGAASKNKKNFIVEFLDGLAEKERLRVQQRRDFLLEERQRELEKIKRIEEEEKRVEEHMLKELRQKEEKEQQKRLELQEVQAKREIQDAIRKASVGHRGQFFKNILSIFRKKPISSSQHPPLTQPPFQHPPLTQPPSQQASLQSTSSWPIPSQKHPAKQPPLQGHLSISTSLRLPLSGTSSLFAKPSPSKVDSLDLAYGGPSKVNWNVPGQEAVEPDKTHLPSGSQSNPAAGDDELAKVKKELFAGREALESLDTAEAKSKYLKVIGLYKSLSPEHKSEVYEDIKEFYEDRKHAEVMFIKK